MKLSAAPPSMDRQAPKKRDTVMTPRMFMLTAAVATLSGNMLRTTSSRESRAEAGGAVAAAGVGAACSKMTLLLLFKKEVERVRPQGDRCQKVMTRPHSQGRGRGCRGNCNNSSLQRMAHVSKVGTQEEAVHAEPVAPKVRLVAITLSEQRRTGATARRELSCSSQQRLEEWSKSTS